MLKIGNLVPTTNLVLPAVAGYSDVGMRALCKRYGAGLTFTEMVSAKALLYQNAHTLPLLATDESEDILGVQLFGSDKACIASAIQLKELAKFDILDLNFGCPMPKIFNNGEGSAIMKSPSLAYEIVKAAVGAAGGRAVTVKMRAGVSAAQKNAVEVATACEEAGASMVTVHGRTTDMLYGGQSEREIIAKVKQAVHIPVVANGDVSTREDYLSMLQDTGADGVAVARAAIGRPFVFALLRGVPYGVPDAVMLIKEHLSKLLLVLPEHVAVANMRKHLTRYLKGTPIKKETKQRAMLAKTACELFSLLDEKG